MFRVIAGMVVGGMFTAACSDCNERFATAICFPRKIFSSSSFIAVFATGRSYIVSGV